MIRVEATQIEFRSSAASALPSDLKAGNEAKRIVERETDRMIERVTFEARNRLRDCRGASGIVGARDDHLFRIGLKELVICPRAGCDGEEGYGEDGERVSAVAAGV